MRGDEEVAVAVHEIAVRVSSLDYELGYATKTLPEVGMVAGKLRSDLFTAGCALDRVVIELNRVQRVFQHQEGGAL
ncbi:hypothetical protein [Nocardioides albertanoniae]|uniref:hypothetical protein n=1 Tax=Nocardioides albertanoniae TaxID=1175486 RepID=UPI001152786A|nr:hypothetical protein [Nocardioides albertanoniae]